MKNGLLILNIVLLLAVAILFYLHFSSGKKDTSDITTSKQSKEAAIYDTTKGCKIGYFEMDSIDNNLEVMKSVRKELEKTKDSLDKILGFKNTQVREKTLEFQKKFQTMTPADQDKERFEINQKQNEFDETRQQYSQWYMDTYNTKNQQVRGEIQDFLKEYNKDRKLSFILAYDPGIIYYKDTIYDI